MNRYFAAERENFRSVYLYLCKKDVIEKHISNLEKHGFTDVKAYDFDTIDNMMSGNNYHPHVIMFDETLFPGDMWHMSLDPQNMNEVRHDMKEKYGFIRCFIPDPLCFYAATSFSSGDINLYYDMYDIANNLRSSYHSQQEIDNLTVGCAEDEKSPTEEQLEEDAVLYFELAQ